MPRRPTPLPYPEMERRLIEVARLAVLALQVPRVPRKAREIVLEIVSLVSEARLGDGH